MKPEQTFRTKCLGGTLLVMKSLNDCITIERDRNNRPQITDIEGQWTADEMRQAFKCWNGSDAQRR